jgi:hypothetical protein
MTGSFHGGFMKKALLLFLIVIINSKNAYADFDFRPGLMGILSLPQIFGGYPCDKSKPEEVPLFSNEQCTKKIGRINVAGKYVQSADGGCKGLDIKVQMNSKNADSGELPTQEFGYEEKGVLVIAKKGKNYKIALSNGYAWVCPGKNSRFYTLEDLYSNHFTHMRSWDGYLFPEAGKKVNGVKFKISEGFEPSVKILAKKIVKGKTWYMIKLPVEDACGDLDKSIIQSTGWVPAYDKDGYPSIWFSSRGC